MPACEHCQLSGWSGVIVPCSRRRAMGCAGTFLVAFLNGQQLQESEGVGVEARAWSWWMTMNAKTLSLSLRR